MKKLVFAFLLFFLFSCAVRRPSGTAGWIQLFNGKDLNDWIIKIKDHPLGDNYANTFRVEDGVLKVRYDGYEEFNRQYGHIYYKQPFSYYLLEMEYRFVGEQVKGGEGWALRNSGAMLHCQSPQSLTLQQEFPISIEMQVLGGNGKDPRATGNLCTPATNVVMKGELFTPHCVNSTSKTYHGEQWVRAGALVLGDSLMQHLIEGDAVISYTHPQYDEGDTLVQQAGFRGGNLISGGYIALQSESHPVEFRNVRLFNLEPYKNNPQKLRQVVADLRRRKE